jgi:dTDP-glucose pyrophosphorylase
MKNITITKDITIKKAMEKLSKEGERCLVVVSSKNKFLGTITDGDIRKSLLNGFKISNSVNDVFNKKATYLVKNKYNVDQVKKLFIENNFDLIPVVDEYLNLEDIIFISSIIGKENLEHNKDLNVDVVVMAGGKGTRLKPFTNILPKPLIPIDEKPVIEHIIERFLKIGCKSFHFTINYKAKIIKAYFEELDTAYKTKFIIEEDFLGTAGSLSYLENKFKKPFFVTNCDIIINADYRDFYNYHIENDYDITLVASAKEYVIPYGSCEIDKEGSLKKIHEKPKYDFLINTGLYVLNPSVLKRIPKSKYFHITHLIEKIKNENGKIGVYPISDQDWIDIGQWSDYHKAINDLKL